MQHPAGQLLIFFFFQNAAAPNLKVGVFFFFLKATQSVSSNPISPRFQTNRN